MERHEVLTGSPTFMLIGQRRRSGAPRAGHPLATQRMTDLHLKDSWE